MNRRKITDNRGTLYLSLPKAFCEQLGIISGKYVDVRMEGEHLEISLNRTV